MSRVELGQRWTLPRSPQPMVVVALLEGGWVVLRWEHLGAEGQPMVTRARTLEAHGELLP